MFQFALLSNKSTYPDAKKIKVNPTSEQEL